jgi:hypothetical protein
MLAGKTFFPSRYPCADGRTISGMKGIFPQKSGSMEAITITGSGVADQA